MNVWEVCSQEAVTISEHAQLSEAARLMDAEHIGAVIVTGGTANRPTVLGIVTDRDIVCTQLERTLDLSQLTAGDAMSRDPLVLFQNGQVDAAIEHMRARGVRAVPPSPQRRERPSACSPLTICLCTSL